MNNLLYSDIRIYYGNTNGFLNKKGTHVIRDATLHRTSNFGGGRHDMLCLRQRPPSAGRVAERAGLRIFPELRIIFVCITYIYIYRVYIPSCGDLSSSLYSFVSSTVPPSAIAEFSKYHFLQNGCA